MNVNKDIIIYIVSGPCGVGKSTVTRELTKKLNHTALISGDIIMNMLGEDHLAWDEKLKLTWINILSLSRNFVEHKLNVVIDFVVESELEWLVQNLSELPVKIKYIVLIADEDTLKERLHKRGDPQLLERSLFLLKQLGNCEVNKKHLFDAKDKNPLDISDDLIHHSGFYIHN
ncbi:guanylate kinase [Peribacillus deserti]|uniref:Guanylate kinase n=1 Tax=Peribacillus deserti TaxID=673318 RepID=A0ABS2QCC3_9BACI|nr:guanylate kinase [Peribacillus deserti]